MEEERNLGLTFNRYLTWTDHRTSTVGKVYGMLRTLWVNQYYTPIKIRLLLAKTYLLPTLMPGCAIYSNCDNSDKNKLNLLYNNIARYIYGLRKYDHISKFSMSIYSMTFDALLNLELWCFYRK